HARRRGLPAHGRDGSGDDDAARCPGPSCTLAARSVASRVQRNHRAAMKLVRGIVREEQVFNIIDALERTGTSGITVTSVHGRGVNRQTAYHRGLPYPALTEMRAIEVIACDNAADDIARVMVDVAHTGSKGDGHVFVIPID